MPKLNKTRTYLLSGLKTLIAFICNALRGDVRSFGAFYQRLVNSPTAQNQLAAFDELFSFYYSLSFNCSSGNNAPNTRQEGGVR